MSTNDETQDTTMEGVEIMAENVQGDGRHRKRARGCRVKKRKKTSACWLSFEELPLGDDEIERAKCRKCGVIFQCDSATGTGSMLRHHKSCYTSTDSNVVSPQSATRSSKFNYERFCELLIEAIVRHDLPFSFVEYEGIRAVFSYISPTLRLPSRNTVKAHVLKLFKSEKLKLETLLSSVQGRICLTSDLWTSVATDGYLTITAHFIDSEWRLQKRIINFCRMPPPHNGIALAEKINALLGEWGIEKKLFSITLDNASANDSFVEKLKTQLNFRGLLLMNGKFFHIRCCAHILNLIVQDGLKAIDHSVIKIRDCIKYIKSSSARKERFFDCVAQVGMRGCRRGLRQDVPTRWNSTYLMLDSALFYRRALINLGLSDNDFKFCPSLEEWNKIEKISKFLGYFYEVTCLFSGTKYPTSNLFFPKVFIVQHSIKQAMRDQDTFMRQMGFEMNLKFEKYWSDYSLTLGIAVVMDPRYKMQFVEWAYNKLYGADSSQMKLFSDTLSSLFNVYVEKCSNPNTSSCSMNESSSQTQGEDIFFEEFWVGNEEFVNMYLERLGDAGYSTFKLARTNNRGDGLLTAVRRDCFRVLNYRELHFNDFGDRVAQLLHVQLISPFSQNQRGNLQQEILIVNTHLLFPHDSSLSIVRLHQVYKILQFVESYQNENQLNHMPIILCGDWNGSKRGHVYKFLRSQGFESAYDTAHEYTDNDAHKWVSHRNHRGNICGVDFIWLCNPNKSRKPLKTSWCEAVFGILRRQLRKASMAENDAFAFLKGDNHGDFITSSAFCEALHQETRDLWIQADTDAIGVLDYEEFKSGIWSCTGSDQKESINGSREEFEQGTKEALGFKVKNAVLYPSEAEKGTWPENYTLSDHARLTVVLSPEKMWCSRC